MGPCLCGDPWCPHCGDPATMRAMEAEIQRTEAIVGPDFEGRAVCSCGAVLIDNEGEARVLDRTCATCWAEDHPEPYEPEPDFGPVHEDDPNWYEDKPNW